MDDMGKRQAAAAYLRAAELTHDEAERASLRRRAAELLAPRCAASSRPPKRKPPPPSRTSDVTHDK